MPKTTTTLTGVSTRNGNSPRGSWVLTIFTAADGGEFSTFDGALASKASSLINQSVVVDWEPYTKDGRDRRTLTGVELAAEAKYVPEEAPVNNTQAVAPAAPYPTKNNDQFRTKEQIMRTDALNAALTMFGIIGLDPLSGVDEFEGWFNSLYKLIEAGVFETPDVRVEA